VTGIAARGAGRESPLSDETAMPPADPGHEPSRELRSVLLLTQIPPPYGGLAVHSERLRAMLERRGWRAEVLSAPRWAAFAGRRFARLRLYAAQARFLARLLCRRCALVHDHVSTYAIGEPSAGAAIVHLLQLCALRLGRSPWVVTSGNGLLPGQLAAAPRWRHIAYRRLYGGASFAIAKSEPIRAAFEQLGLAGRTEVIGTFLDPVAPTGARPLPPAVHAYLEAHPVCISSAGFSFQPLYHLDAVVRAAAYVRKEGPEHGLPGDAGLVILASHAEDPVGKRAFDAALAETGLEGDVLVLRDVDNALDVVSKTSVFVRATDVDGDANTVKEAMLLGVPVVATDLPGRPPGIRLIGRGEMADLGAAVLAALRERDAPRLEAARAFVKQDIERNASAILGVYDRAGGA